GPEAKEAIPAVEKLLKHRNRTLRCQAAYALWRIDPRAKEVLPTLVTALGHDNEKVRERAAQVLGLMGPAARAALPDLTKALKEENEPVRAPAARVLGRVSVETVGPLRDALHDDDPRVRSAAVAGLREVGPAARDAAPALIELLKDAREGMRL